MRKRIEATLAACCLVLVATTATAQQFTSGPAQTAMVELFTSQGCSSCPPAEHLLNGYRDDPALWSTFVPLAFHVDYWDYLGWRDRFALPANAGRQRLYADQKGVNAVYTPAFLVNGKGWRPGWPDRTPQASGEPAGVLQVTLNGARYEAHFEGTGQTSAPLILNLAILGMGLETAIRAGENAGRTSPHDFVVLSHQQFGSEDARWQGRLEDWEDHGAQGLALAAWVSRPGRLAPLQATGGFIAVTGK